MSYWRALGSTHVRIEIHPQEWALPLAAWYFPYVKNAGITLLCLSLWIELPR